MLVTEQTTTLVAGDVRVSIYSGYKAGFLLDSYCTQSMDLCYLYGFWVVPFQASLKHTRWSVFDGLRRCIPIGQRQFLSLTFTTTPPPKIFSEECEANIETVHCDRISILDQSIKAPRYCPKFYTFSKNISAVLCRTLSSLFVNHISEVNAHGLQKSFR
ncbi:hypothetical protein HAX54_003912 [Datura stramonium]|uniref:Uncharacterized protein n=1 Tax=Datura stramonium TaxID=4076 RepID=A0ABS8T6W9_DATST|nr:hypothetical protein [Datura stramonium]